MKQIVLKSRKITLKTIKLELRHEIVALLTKDQLRFVNGASGATCTTTTTTTTTSETA